MNKNIINDFHTSFTCDAYEYFGSHYDSQTRSIAVFMHPTLKKWRLLVILLLEFECSSNEKITKEGIWN